MLKQYRKPRNEFKDAKGNFTVELSEGEIVASLLHPQDGSVLRMWSGKTAKEVYLQLSNDVRVDGSHAIYLGTELQKAELALKKGLCFEQDKELKF